MIELGSAWLALLAKTARRRSGNTALLDLNMSQTHTSWWLPHQQLSAE